MIDSHGKPGIAGSTIGVETELVSELTVVVGVLSTVNVDTEVLSIVLATELVVSTVVTDSLDEVTLELELAIDEDSTVVPTDEL
jgi:hypothetical protein